MKKIIGLLSLIAFSNLYSDPIVPEFWQDVSNDIQPLEISGKLHKSSQQFVKRSLRLDEASLRDYLTASSTQTLTDSMAAKPSQKFLDLPLPDNDSIRVKVVDEALLSNELQQRYPDTHAWRVVGVDDPAVSGRIDITSNGFHGMLILENGDTVYIDPDKNNSGLYSSFSKEINVDHFKTEFNCQVHDHESKLDIGNNLTTAAKTLAASPSQNLITYRLALAGTGEYTQSQGGTSSSAYASMITTINRVNEIYQRDLGVKLQLVTDESIVYTDSSADPYTNNSAMSLVSENIENLNKVIGSENYDIGHVFAQGSLGGLAFAASACQESYKAGGATGTPTPNGETFSVEYVAHELGHQLGATHTFNSEQRSCSGNNRVQITAVEPGSGSTIMSYSGLCGTDNIQTVSDAVFHWASIDQITEYTNNATGNTCGTRTSTVHEDLSVDAKEDLNIPANTPFMLKGATSGGVTYSWDQLDTGAASSVAEDLGENAIIRSLLPNSESTRYIPSLTNLFEETTLIGETLPKMNRELNFAFLARGQKGGIATDFKKLLVTDSGSVFKVLSHTNPEILQQGQETLIEWDVAGTNSSPINCKEVDIQLIRLNGVKNVLLEGTANDGNENVTIPLTTPDMQEARIMVACNNDSFFNISSAKLEIGESNGSKQTGASGGGSFNVFVLFLMLLNVFKIASLNINLFRKRQL
ncbi:reprolysin-like metallopeptidase [uncultured Cocleimonas sp.]|uniref:reprolysin-like metallopeptidase n=1 Tax=uncultured Cocleimonas sp. TaxID=1051587 RepID=UPI0026194E34|nr:zinc-dependent metalloprotease family protein [uncultured Cocleimonas sp.]